MNAQDQLIVTKLQLCGTCMNTIVGLINQKYAQYGDKNKGQLFTPSPEQQALLDEQVQLNITDLLTFIDALRPQS